MDLRDLAWLVTVADVGHVTDAAALVGTSQPTLSRALARVEAELGSRVFERLPTGVRPTPAGEVVLAAARQLTARHQQLVRDLAAALDPEAGVVRLAFLDSQATSLVPEVLAAFHAEAPRVRVELRQEPGHEIVADLERGAVDLAFTMERPQGDYGWAPLAVEQLVLVVPPHHRLRGRRRVGLAELAGDELVTTPPGFGHRRLVDDLMRDAGVAPAVAFESEDLTTIVGLVAAGLGVAVVPDVVAARSGAEAVPLEGAARRTIGLTWRTDHEPTPPAERLRRFVLARADALSGAGQDAYDARHERRVGRGGQEGR
ncbi:LysR family transcriptional regulator [Nocardioides aestuarii]|uniref:LysR family transcriptional regulator n=1 Tax=Nocardioides aestuarii TaxID=252231 RepID=A0ABW4TQC9_9ACTN